jgi:hypothetical protein
MLFRCPPPFLSSLPPPVPHPLFPAPNFSTGYKLERIKGLTKDNLDYQRDIWFQDKDVAKTYYVYSRRGKTTPKSRTGEPRPRELRTGDAERRIDKSQAWETK